MKCPGQDSRYWKPGAIFDVKCPNCGTMIEFFKDDTRRRCPGCGKEVPNPEMDFGCAAYCPYAEHCLGSLPEGVVADGKMKVLKAKMLRALKEKDFPEGRNIALASRFVELVEEIAKKESAPLGPTLLAAFGYCFLDFCQNGSHPGKETTDTITVRLEEALKKADAESNAIKEASKILKHVIQRGEENYSLAEKVILDAWQLASADCSEHNSILDEADFLTDAARQLYLARTAGS